MTQTKENVPSEDTHQSGIQSDNHSDANHSALTHAISDKNTWARLLWMCVYIAVGYIVALGSIFLAFVQWLFTLLSGSKNNELDKLLTILCAFLFESMRYVLHLQEQKPFPFAPIQVTPSQDNAR